MTAHDIMTPHPTAVTRTDSIRHAAELMAQIDVGALPVVDSHDNNQLVGIITDRDIVIRHMAKGGGRDCRVGDHMTARDVQYVHAYTNVQDVLGRMKHGQFRRVPVVDGDDHLVGMISLADVARHNGHDVQAVGEALKEISTPHHLQVQVPA